MSPTDQQQFTIFDDPQSKIHFLEETLEGEDWRASIIYPGKDEQSIRTRAEVKLTLEKHGYTVGEHVDKFGHYVLELHHHGEGGKFVDTMQEMGLGHGLTYTLRHPGMSFSEFLQGGRKAERWLMRTLHDPAKANGLINTTAEVFLIAAGKSHYGKFTDAKNILMSLAGFSWLSQSLLYLTLAKSNEQTTLDHLTKKLKDTEKAGGDITKISYDHGKDKEANGFGHGFVNFLRRYPVQIGAMLNNIGMLFYLGHAVLEKRFRQTKPNQTAQDLDYITKGFKHDVGGALLSLAGWTTLLISPKKKEKQVPKGESDTIFAHAWHKFRENPQTAAGLFTLAASSQRLMGANSKENTMQKIGESLYIGGDLALMFTNSHEYGGNELRIEKLSEHLAEYIQTLPFILGPEAQQTFVHNTVHYLLEKALADIAANPDRKGLTPQDITERSTELELVLGRKIRHQHNEHLERVGEIGARLASRFPHQERAALIENLAQALHEMPWVHATPAEMQTVITEGLKHTRPVPAPRPMAMRDIKKEVAELAHVIPGLDLGVTAGLMHDAVAPFIHPPITEKPVTHVDKTSASHEGHLAALQAESAMAPGAAR